MGHANGIVTGPNVDPYGDVAHVLGRDTGDVVLLCKDLEYYDTGNVDGNGNPIYATRDAHSINKWARYKPVQSNNDTILSDLERSLANHGFILSGSDSILEYSIPLLFTRYAATNGEYKYMKPTGWCRILDFIPPSLTGNGYNAGAPMPFVYNNPTSGSSYVQNYTLNVVLGSSAAAELTIKDIIENNQYQTDMTKWYIGLAMKYTKNGSAYYKFVRAKTTDGYDTPRTLAAFVKGENLYAEIELDGYRTYEMMWIATEIDPSTPTAPGACVYLPLGGFSYVFSQATYTQYYTFAWSGSNPYGASQYAYDKKGEYVPCVAISFNGSMSRITMATVAPESRTASIKCTPVIYTRNGDVITCDYFYLSQGGVSCNTTNPQTIDTTVIGTVLLESTGEHYAVSDVDYVILYTDVDIDSGGSMSIITINSGGQQSDIINSF